MKRSFSPKQPPTNGTTPSPVRAPAHVTNVAEGSGEPKAGSAQATTLLTSTPHSRSEVKSRDQQLLQPSPILAPPRMAKSTEEPGGLVERPADVATQNKSPYFHPLNEEPRDQQLSEPSNFLILFYLRDGLMRILKLQGHRLLIYPNPKQQE